MTGMIIALDTEETLLLRELVTRWRFEIQDNLANLDINMPKELQGMMRDQLNNALEIADNLLGQLHES